MCINEDVSILETLTTNKAWNVHICPPGPDYGPYDGSWGVFWGRLFIEF